MERKALGKGISALIPKAEVSEEMNSRKIAFLQITQIKPNPFQPREDFNQEALEELVNSIKEKGIIQPILVRTKGDAYELIAGERRLRAAQILKMTEVPAIIKEVEDRDSLELALIENIQRQDLNSIEQARAYQYLLDKFQLTQEEVSEVLGKARVTVTNVLRLLKLPLEIQESIKSGKLSFGHGRALLEVEDPNLQRKLVQEIVHNSLSVRELETIIRTKRVRKPKVITRVLSEKDPLTRIMEEQLQEVLATRIKIVKKKKRGHIIIEFYSHEDLERIVNKLRGELTNGPESSGADPH
jgi:ParB family transcriptional regulator, chromosome partitioning protein